MRPEEIAVTILDRRATRRSSRRSAAVGARVYLITDGDVAGAIAAATPRSGVDLLYGIGGTPEGVIAAAALKCLGGAIQGRLYPRDDAERQTLIDEGFDLDAVLTTDDLVSGDHVFFAATGITDGTLLRGVQYWPDGATTLLHGDALAFGHGALGRGRAPVRETRTILPHRVSPLTFEAIPIGEVCRILRASIRRGRPEMAEKTILVCDACGKPAAETVTIKTSRGNFVKDLCSTHVNELVAGARKPRPGRRKGATVAAAQARRRQDHRQDHRQDRRRRAEEARTPPQDPAS